MRYTSEMLMKDMGLQVGDRISAVTADGIPTICKIEKIGGSIFYEKEGNVYSLINLVGREFEILPRLKRVGDLKCTDEIECKYCPLRMANCTSTKNATLYKLLEEIKGIAISGDYFDQEIYNLLEARLDKEVKE